MNEPTPPAAAPTPAPNPLAGLSGRRLFAAERRERTIALQRSRVTDERRGLTKVEIDGFFARARAERAVESTTPAATA